MNTSNLSPAQAQATILHQRTLINNLCARAIRCGTYTFHFTFLINQVTGQQDIARTCGMLVQGGEIVSHNIDMAHHGDCILNVAYALFDASIVSSHLQNYQQSTTGAMNGTGGMAAAVVCVMRAEYHLRTTCGLPNAAAEVMAIARHIFIGVEIHRAVAEVLASP